MAEKQFKDNRKAWDADTMGYGKHSYRHLDPDTINVEDFARDLRGEQQHTGDVREENTAYNEQSKENSISLDMLSKIGTVFRTFAEGWEGAWIVTGMPVVRSPAVYCRVRRAVKVEGIWQEEAANASAEEQLSCVELGCAVDVGNKFRQVRGEILVKGKHQNLG